MRSAFHSQDVSADVINKLYCYSFGLLARLITNDGRIFASEDNRFHHFFARDTMYTALFVADTYKNRKNAQNKALFLNAKKAVIKFWDFQTEEGKIPHEIKPFKGNENDPLYKRGFYYKFGNYLVNNESVDATPLALIATAKLLKDDCESLEKVKSKVVRAIEWMIKNMETFDGWLSFVPNRRGITCQGWMDSVWGVTTKNGRIPQKPVAVVEAQAMAWEALQLWGQLLDGKMSERLRITKTSLRLREKFHKEFVIRISLPGRVKTRYLAHARILKGSKVHSISINPGFCLSSVIGKESFVKREYISEIVHVLMSDFLFHYKGGVRTFASFEDTYDPENYHSGRHVFWPFANCIVASGMVKQGPKYHAAARMIMTATVRAIVHYGFFIEHFQLSKTGSEYRRRLYNGDSNSRNQTWTVASFWWMMHHPVLFNNYLVDLPSFD